MEGYENWNGQEGQDAYGGQAGYGGQDAYYNQNGYEGQDKTDYYAYGQNEPQADGESVQDGAYRVYEGSVSQKDRGEAKEAIKRISLMLVFGFVMCFAFAGTAHFFQGVSREGNSLGNGKDTPMGADFNIVETTEMAEQALGTEQEMGAVTDVSGIVEQAEPSIVSITTIARTKTPGFFFREEREYENEGCGSGIILSQDEESLYIATNNHVVEGAQSLTVLFSDGNSVSARIKGTDVSSDLAVVSVPLEEIEEETRRQIRTATFGDSKGVKIGQTAIVIGNALGYGQSVTTGVVSALDREVTVANETDGSTITNELLQTSAAINPGNSGGALLNGNGEVIGITSVKYAETSVEGMGYAIPVDTALPIIRQLITREVVTGADIAYLGISGVDVTQSISETYQQMPQGIYVAHIVEGSGADEAGMLQGDIITRFDGRNVKSMDEVQELMKYLPAGTVVEVTVQRAKNGEYVKQELDVALGAKN